MNYAFRINFALALVVIAFFTLASFASAQTTNYYTSMNPSPGSNPSVTNAILPGSTNIPTGNTNNAVIPGVQNTGTTQVPGVPNTGSTPPASSGQVGPQTPGVPNTGAGGESLATTIALAVSALLALAGIVTYLRTREM